MCEPPAQPPAQPPMQLQPTKLTVSHSLIMDVEEAGALAYLFLKLRKRKKKRSFWVHPFLRDRSTRGTFFTQYQDLRNNPDKFYTYSRMSVSSFDELLGRVEEKISGQSTRLRDSIPPEEKLLLTLSYLGSGVTMTQLHIYYRLGLSTISCIIREVTKEIWISLKNECIPVITAEQWKCISNDFESVTNYPNCVGALDGKHVRLTKPWNSGSMYYNYKNYFSVVLLAMCDANYQFTFIDAGAYGKESDSSVFKKSALHAALKNKTFQLPEAQPISESSSALPYVIVADEAFALSNHIMRPFPRKSLTRRKKVYNYRHSRARRMIECSFGLLSNKWQIFHRAMNVDVSLAEDIIKACCILHNFVRKREGYNFEETLNVTGFHELEVDVESRGTKEALTVRDKFAEYFDSPEGALEWQYRVI
ncbi:uncharacterized protein LOC128984546 [Macrosteles quadrilineatus]|uniref:uncharacterized protein LOC128984546 n=1 Tax=Macrosteles quadrilineatus TaxID=74068 RepID=UPI0023E26842|nr:uncharacterized protein LOC128984546 [Macrosteles quadrilineatus]